MRGNPTVGVLPALALGSIPAHAGEPSSLPVSVRLSRVYPRACGGTRPGSDTTGDGLGLSPRMRGNPVLPSPARSRRGSNPAHAGEPVIRISPIRLSRVYPRACGGTTAGRPAMVRDTGLSPRMRGNRVQRFRAVAHKGSIPAHAGEPAAFRVSADENRVYPRACGGTLCVTAGQQHPGGLSPRMRGNPSDTESENERVGSIPAHAGEPLI